MCQSHVSHKPCPRLAEQIMHVYYVQKIITEVCRYVRYEKGGEGWASSQKRYINFDELKRLLLANFNIGIKATVNLLFYFLYLFKINF